MLTLVSTESGYVVYSQFYSGRSKVNRSAEGQKSHRGCFSRDCVSLCETRALCVSVNGFVW